jgi:translocator protein
MMSRRRSLLVFIIAVVGIGWLVGATNLPGAWYASLNKPPFNPPNWVFAPAWTVLYILVAIAGWLTWVQEQNGRALQLWFAQMLLNFSWPPIFFGLHNVSFGLAIILMLLATIAAFMLVQAKANRLAALLFMPYAAWVSFASLLNYSLLRLN